MKLLILSCLLVLLSPLSSYSAQTHSLSALPVQDGGRLKPFDTFAKESLRLIHGRERFKSPATGKKQKATDVVMTWMIVPELWNDMEFVLVRHNGVREYLKLDHERLYYSPNEIMQNDRVGLLIQELNTKRSTREKLNPFFQAAQTLENQIGLFHGIKLGLALRVMPAPEGDKWLSVNELSGAWATSFQNITKAFAKVIGNQEGANPDQLNGAVAGFMSQARSEFGARYGDGSKIKAELQYNKANPFMWAWIFLVLCALFMTFALNSEKKVYPRAAWVFAFVGTALCVVGMVVRSYITGRGPVTNMYETVIWVGFGTVVFSMILEKIQKKKIILLSGCIIGAFCLILSSMAPSVLDGSLQPLEPVLRDNFWLLTHVLIITMSYGAFFLAFILGDIALFAFMRDEEKYAERIKHCVQGIYRSVQIGVVLLAAGTILGGIWADYSWGRFWGWDPKETWALIALLGYLALLHARLVGMVRAFGMAVGAILAFSLVIMAWYGVNFVLGAGLHTYGFGAGGVEYVSGFVAVHILFVTYVAATRYAKKK